MAKPVITAALALSLAGLVAASSPVSSALSPAGQSDLDGFMQKVVARRDENWKKLQQYVLDETELVQVRGPAQLPIWGDKREYTWFIKEGYFVRSPLKANGVTIREEDRRKYEERYLRRAKARDKRDAEARAKKNADGSIVLPIERIPEEPPATLDAFLNQSRQPDFIDSAYFLKFKFEQGKYALVGRESVEGQEVLRIEYYPARLFSEDRDRQAEREKKQDPKRSRRTIGGTRRWSR